MTWTKVDQQGRVVIPAEIRAQMGIEPGKPIAFVIEHGKLGLMTIYQDIKRAQKIAAKYIKREPALTRRRVYRREEKRAEAARE